MASDAIPVPAVPRPASSLVLLRQGESGIETLLIQRSLSMRFMPGHWVFPGGAVDAADSSSEVLSRVAGAPSLAPRRLGYAVAAVRELFEETGILLAEGGSNAGSGLDLTDWRERLYRREVTFLDLLEAHDLYVPASRIRYLQHRVTPEIRPIRFDTRFFTAVVNGDSPVKPYSEEVAGYAWRAPAETLRTAEAGGLAVPPPTRTALRKVQVFASAAEVAAGLLSLTDAFADHVWNRTPETGG